MLSSQESGQILQNFVYLYFQMENDTISLKFQIFQQINLFHHRIGLNWDQRALTWSLNFCIASSLQIHTEHSQNKMGKLGLTQ